MVQYRQIGICRWLSMLYRTAGCLSRTMKAQVPPRNGQMVIAHRIMRVHRRTLNGDPKATVHEKIGGRAEGSLSPLSLPKKKPQATTDGNGWQRRIVSVS
jgi:hypothetical protein